MRKRSMKLSNQLKTKLKKRLASATVIFAVLVLVFACSKIDIYISQFKSSISKSENQPNAGNEIDVVQDSNGISLDITCVDDSVVTSMEVYQDTMKIQEFSYTDGQKEKKETVNIVIPFGATNTITLKANGETVAQKNVSNMRYISTPADLASFRDIVNNGNTFDGKYVELLNDIDMSSLCSSAIGTWVPIGDSNGHEGVKFSGTFNGRNHTISNIYININGYTQGLFGYCLNAKLLNLKMKNGYIRMTTKDNSGAGPFAGKFESSSGSYLINQSVEVRGNVNIGGVVGICTTGAVLKCCANYGTIVGNHSAGGIAGVILSGATIDACFNAGYIETNTSISSNGWYLAAGIAGYMGVYDGLGGNSIIIRNCYNKGNVYGYSDASGVTSLQESAGYYYVQNCYSTGTLSGPQRKYAIVSSHGGYRGYPTQIHQNNYWRSGCGASYGAMTRGVEFVRR